MKTKSVKRLLVVSAAVEIAAGSALLAAPALLVSILLGAGNAPATPIGRVVARVAGAALLSLGVACSFARSDVQALAARGVVASMLLYDALAFGVLVYSGLALRAHGVGLWPAAALHLLLAVWCVACLTSSSAGNLVTK